jgi:tetratricopeptide (TPR) repeat protein
VGREATLVQGLLTLAIALATTQALAQGSSNEAEAEAKAAMKRGMAAFSRRDPDAALAEYKKAQRLVPDANLPHRYAAEALVELERYDEALREYEAYLRIKPDVSDAGDVQKRMDLVRAKLEGLIDITSTPAGASLFVDGSSTKVGVTPMTALRLRRGSHTIVAQLPGRRDVVLSPVVRSGETLALTASFNDAAGTSDASPGPEGSKGGRTLGWIALGAGGAVLGAALVVDLFMTASAFDTFEADRRRDDPAAGGALSRARHLQTTALAGYIAGGALVATGVVIVLWPRSKSASIQSGRASWSPKGGTLREVGPGCGGTLSAHAGPLGVGLSGTF